MEVLKKIIHKNKNKMEVKSKGQDIKMSSNAGTQSASTTCFFHSPLRIAPRVETGTQHRLRAEASSQCSQEGQTNL